MSVRSTHLPAALCIAAMLIVALAAPSDQSILPVAGVGSAAAAAAGGEGGISTLPPGISPSVERAIQSGLRYLANTQGSDGDWRARGAFGGHPVAMTSLAGLAFLSAGNTPTEGPYARNVRMALTYVLRNANPNTGLIANVAEEGSKSMYAHGYAMLFLAEAYGMESDPRNQEQIRRALQRAVRLSQDSQSTLGGWYYTPDSTNDEGSVTITQVQGLRAARNAGILVSKQTMDNAIGYLEKSANPDGGIRYTARSAGGSLPAITAQAVAALYNAGSYDHPLAPRALRFLEDRMRGGDIARAFGGHRSYSMFYASQAFYLSGDERWNRFFPQLRSHLLDTQATNGSWPGDFVGETYGTAIAVMCLSLPYNHLPIFQR